MNRLALIVVLLFASPATAQKIYKCADGKGGNTYQQTACASEATSKGVRSFKREPDAPRSYSQPPEYRQPARRDNAVALSGSPSPGYVEPPQAAGDAPSGYVRCPRKNGSTRLQKGTSCRVNVDHQAGMVTDVSTGQQRFMVPGGGNGMIDPQTGQRHELISPPPTRRVQGEPASRAEVCAQARAHFSDPNRTMNSIRAAEARAREVCDG